MNVPLEPFASVGPYQILSLIGEGSFGAVYLASHGLLRRRVALKVLQTDRQVDEETKELFLREARLIASFHHPRILEVFDAGEEQGRLYLALRHMPGGSIDDLLVKSGGKLDEMHTLELVRDIAEGLEVIEGLGMVHRDIKPANVLLDETGRGVIADLGTALLVHEGKSLQELGTLTPRSAARGLAGTPIYLAPELCQQAGTANITTDIYALGVTMYVCLTGKMPFQARNLLHLFYMIMNSPFPDVREERPDVRESTARVLSRLTARDPAERFQSAEQVLEAVSELLGQRRTQYKPPRERASLAEVVHLSTQLEANPLMKTLMEALPTPSLVISGTRQIVGANAKALAFLGLQSEDELLGKRPGEAFGCVEAAHGRDGCGTAPRCRLCGLAQTVSEAMQGCPLPIERICHVTTEMDGLPGAFDVQARFLALPVLQDQPIYLVTMSDISDSLRRRMLHKVFLQEMMNSADVVRELSAEIRVGAAELDAQLSGLTGKLIRSAEDLLDQIVYQHQAAAAEEGDLQPVPEHTDLPGVMQWASDWWQRFPTPRTRRLVVQPGEPLVIRTDTMLLRRVLSTLLEGEREWVPEGGELRVGYQVSDDRQVVLWLRHDGVLTPEEQMQMFKRETPNTSRRDRGPYTYLARLLTERYLHGKVQVESSAGQGTVFEIHLPLSL
ncbi:MAG: protein kinase [Gemmataceae bacterium]